MRFWRSYALSSLSCFVVLLMAAAVLGVSTWTALGAVITYWAAQAWFIVAAYRDFLRDTNGRR